MVSFGAIVAVAFVNGWWWLSSFFSILAPFMVLSGLLKTPVLMLWEICLSCVFLGNKYIKELETFQVPNSNSFCKLMSIWCVPDISKAIGLRPFVSAPSLMHTLSGQSQSQNPFLLITCFPRLRLPDPFFSTPLYCMEYPKLSWTLLLQERRSEAVGKWSPTVYKWTTFLWLLG